MNEFPRLSYHSTFREHYATFRPAGLTDSKIGGAPYRPKGTSWPTDPDGHPFSFVAQLNLEQVERDRKELAVPPLLDGALPTTGLLHFYVQMSDEWGPASHVSYVPDFSLESEDPVFAWKAAPEDSIRWIQEDPHPRQDPEGGHLAPSEHWTLLSILQHPEVPQALETTLMEPACQKPVPGIHIESPIQENMYELCGEYLGFSDHQVGGLAEFPQDDPRPMGSPLRLLLQIRYDLCMQPIGDCGTMHFFIGPTDLAQRDFRNVLMDWSCF
ncbi:DUF1963 domain-containing protein [Corynebacterium sp. H130]|uniref:DUF1963 domain-containing protein n=1 Tax=Corynebacterium sp. H130 TaxID=3133444 RepID=UPI0030A97B65